MNHRGEFHFCLFGGFSESLKDEGIATDVHVIFAFELLCEVIDDGLVDIVAAQVCVAVCGENFDDALGDFEDGDVESAAAEVVDGDFFVFVFVDAIGEGSGRRFVDDASNFESGDFARDLCGSSLSIVEVCGYGDDGFIDGVSQILFGLCFEFRQNLRGDFARAVYSAIDSHAEVAIELVASVVSDSFSVVFVVSFSHETLDGIDSAFWIDEALSSRHFADENALFFGVCDDAWRRSASFGVGDDDGVPAFKDAQNRIGGA